MTRQIIKSKNDIFTFGEHIGERVSQVIAKYPSYILWLDNEEIVKFPVELIEEAEECEPREDDYDLRPREWGDL